MVNPGAGVLAAGIGLWALWQFFEERRTVNRATPERANKPQSPVWRYTWMLIAILCGSWLVFVIDAYDEARIQRINISTYFAATALLAAGILIWALWQLIRGLLPANTRSTLSEIEPRQTSPAREFDLS